MESAQGPTPTAPSPNPIPIFLPHLIPQNVQNLLPETLKLRPLQSNDYQLGHLEILGGLTHVGSITESAWLDRFEWMMGCGGSYYVVVIEDLEGKRIVGTGTLIVEKKFLFNLGIQGHIEDVAIAANQQGKKLGVRIIEVLDRISEHVGCYKTILDCNPKKEGFYLKCGYERRGLEMHKYFDPEAKKHSV